MENLEPEENAESNPEKKPAYRPDGMPVGRPFGKDNQPSGGAKSMGWWKKKRGRQMLKALLELPFDGGQVPVDPKNPNSGMIPNPVKKQAADYFGMPEEFITVEMIMAMKQLALAIQKNDTSAFLATWDRAYGKPKDENDPVENLPPPTFVTNIVKPADVPEILEDEPSDENNTSSDSIDDSNNNELQAE